MVMIRSDAKLLHFHHHHHKCHHLLRATTTPHATAQRAVDRPDPNPWKLAPTCPFGRAHDLKGVVV